MKKLFLFIGFSIISFFAFAQPVADIVIKPGIGVNNLLLGMSEEQVEKMLGEGASWSSYKEQLILFSTDETRVDSLMQFVLGFDSCAKYSSALPESMPIFALYFKKHKLNYITVTSYSASNEQLKAVVMNNGLRFHTPMDDCKMKMGADYVNVGYGTYNGDHYYYKLGVEMIYDEEKLTAISIFPPTPDFKNLIATRSKLILKEVQDANKEE